MIEYWLLTLLVEVLINILLRSQFTDKLLRHYLSDVTLLAGGRDLLVTHNFGALDYNYYSRFNLIEFN